MSSSWPETPFRLIRSTGINTRPQIPSDHFCRRNAQLMALTHNTIFRALNAIYHQAPLIQPSTKDASDLFFYCTVVYDFIHAHHTTEEDVYFPAIEAACAVPGLMATNVKQHQQLETGLKTFQHYVLETPVAAYTPEKLRSLIDDMVCPLETHLHEEIPSILDLHDKIDSDTLRSIYARMHGTAERSSDKFKDGPFVLGNQDKVFLLDGKHFLFPEVSTFVPYIVDWILSYRYQGAWRFNSSDMYGKQKSFVFMESTNDMKPTDITKIKVGTLARLSLVSMSRKWKIGSLFFGLLCLYVFLASELGSRLGLMFELGVLSLVSHLTIVFFIFLVLVPHMSVSGI